MSDAQSYREFQQEVKAEQEGLTKEEIIELMQRRSDWLADLDNLKPQDHNFIDRGEKFSCEGAAHPHHEVWKRR